MKIFFMILIASITLYSQTGRIVTNGVVNHIGTSKTIYYEAIVDSVDSLATNPFTAAGYNPVYATYPIYGTLLLSGGTASTQKIRIVVQGSMDGSTSWTNVDTISVADSSVSVLSKSIDMNSLVYPYYRLSVKGATSANVLTTIKLYLYLWKRE